MDNGRELGPDTLFPFPKSHSPTPPKSSVPTGSKSKCSGFLPRKSLFARNNLQAHAVMLLATSGGNDVGLTVLVLGSYMAIAGERAFPGNSGVRR